MGLKGDFSSIARMKRSLRELPLSVAHDTAQAAGPALTAATNSAYDAGRTVYGESRPTGVAGNQLDLEVTGATKRALRFDASGTVVRCIFGTSYTKFLVGKYGILPNGALPVEWQRQLAALAAEALRNRAANV